MPRTGIERSRGSSIFSFLRRFHIVSMVAVPVCIPTTPIPAFVICRLLNDGYPDLVKLHLTVILIYISLIISSVEHLYMRLLIICMSLWRNVYLGLLTIFWLGCFCCCCCTGCLYISEINPLSVASFASIFSHSVDCLSVLFMVSFAVQKLASLIRSHLFIFAFISIALGTDLRKYC